MLIESTRVTNMTRSKGNVRSTCQNEQFDGGNLYDAEDKVIQSELSALQSELKRRTDLKKFPDCTQVLSNVQSLS